MQQYPLVQRYTTLKRAINLYSAFAFTALCLFLHTELFAQYYYKDLLTLEQNRKKRELFRKEKVHRVKVVSTDTEGRTIPGFSSEQEANRDHSLITTRTTTDLSGNSINSTYFNSEGLPIRSSDSSGDVNTIVEYRYELGRPSALLSTTFSSGLAMASEQHQWIYNGKGIPVKMLLIKNETDTTVVDFMADEKGLIIEEKIHSKGKATREYYYYYDEMGHVTDIVRFNDMARRLLPDYIFEYEASGQVGSMLMVPEDTRSYQQWYYSYDEDGLKILDACYSKEKTLIAKLEYTYTYF